MRIEKINIPESYFDNGLNSIVMNRLSNVVILAGKNGAGKSRILSKIQKCLEDKPKLGDIKNAQVEISNIEKKIFLNNKEIEILENILISQADSLNKSEIKRHINSINNFKNENNNLSIKREVPEAIVNWDYIVTDKFSSKYKTVFFVPKHVELADPNDFTKNQMLGLESKIKKAGVEYLNQGSLATIQLIQNRWFEAEHPSSIVKMHEKELSIGKYRKLQILIKQLLNTDITRDGNGDANIFNFPIGKAHLSDGQKIIIQFCLAILEQDVELKEMILLLDEPENHLHPSILIETIDRIEKILENGQIWIATHSIPLLAHYNSNNIWFVDENKVSNAGRIPEKVLISLLGGDDELLKLKDFINLPDRLAIQRFATECLTAPKIVMTNMNDPQSSEINKILLEISKTRKGKLKILDFGAGKGRLLSNIYDTWNGSKEAFINYFEYFGYDKKNSDNQFCINTIHSIYNDDKKRFFSDNNEMITDLGSNYFNIIVLCNVLHEVHPKEWLKLFNSDGIISNNLDKYGYCLIVEDYQLPTGELAHENGFLILDTAQIRELFNVDRNDFNMIKINSVLDGRIKAHLIPAKILVNINAISRSKCLKSLSNYAIQKIEEIRGNNNQSYKEGTIHSFWIQQFANSFLALKQFE